MNALLRFKLNREKLSTFSRWMWREKKKQLTTLRYSARWKSNTQSDITISKKHFWVKGGSSHYTVEKKKVVQPIKANIIFVFIFKNKICHHGCYGKGAFLQIKQFCCSLLQSPMWFSVCLADLRDPPAAVAYWQKHLVMAHANKKHYSHDCTLSRV